MKKLVESKNYIVLYEYENVFLNFKGSDRFILIGEFYGDPCSAIISDDERFCVIGGEGIIIYYLSEPYLEYKSFMITNQWKEWGRDSKDNVVWVEKIEQIGDNVIRLSLENDDQVVLNV